MLFGRDLTKTLTDKEQLFPMPNKLGIRTRMLITLLFVATSSPAADWLTLGHDPQRSGWANEETKPAVGKLAGLELKWKMQVKNEPRCLTALTAPLVATDVSTAQGRKTLVYVEGSSNNISAMDAASGGIVWTREFESSVLPEREGMLIDFNLLDQRAMPRTGPATARQKLSSQDAHSLQGDALFADEATGDFRAKSNSPALSLGFVNFNMDDFGVQSPKLKAIARQPVLPLRSSDTKPTPSETRGREVAVWADAKVRNFVGVGEVSVAGSPSATGVILLEVPDTNDAAIAGFLAGDVLLASDGKPIKELKDLLQDWQQNVAGRAASVTILRIQQESTIMIMLKP
jgi:PDZ domain